MDFNKRGFLFVLVLVAAAVGNAAAATYVVGDSLGWRVPSTPSDYSNWATQHVFAVGDVLVFNFMTGQHDVAQVSKAAFDGCSSTNPISLATVGPTNATLTSSGVSYYICTFGSHCSLGQKLAINVSTSSAPSPAPSAPTPAPTPSGSPSPMPAPSPAATPPSTAAPGLPPPDSITPPESLSPPPPPTSGTITTIRASLVGFVFIVFGLMV